jgi:hypothetical protein
VTDFDAGAFLASMLVSGIGFVLLVYGKRMSRFPQLAVGLVLFLFPYFVSSVLWMFAIAAVLLGALWFAVRAGF